MVKNDITVKILSELMHYNNYCYVTDLRGYIGIIIGRGLC